MFSGRGASLKARREAIGSKVEVLNIETNETTIYSSNYKAAKALDCSE